MNTKLTLKQAVIVILLIGIIFCSGLVLGWNYGYLGYDWNIFNKKSSRVTDIVRVYNFIQQYFDGDFDPSTSNSFTIEQLVRSLNDPYSYFIPKDQYEKIKKSDQGEFVGIGIIYAYKKDQSRLNRDQLKITEVLPNSPAERAKLKIGDVITSIDNSPVESFGSDREVLNRLKGNKDSVVTIMILDSSQQTRTIPIKRSIFKLPNFKYQKLDSDIGYVKMYRFRNDLKDEFSDIYDQIQKSKVQKLIIDIRNNGGGLAESGNYFLDQFIKDGIFVREKQKSQQKETIYRASGKALLPDIKLIVLVNSQTASEAEVVAAAIQENKRGTIVSEKTYGKGVSIDTFELSDGSAIQLTIGKWFTPTGKWIGGKGIMPDIVIKDEVTSDTDPILEKARDML